jgi:nicotinate-nucleotide adenylyltransferase
VRAAGGREAPLVTGLFGGAFDPPHHGHLALVRGAIAHFGLERVVVIPTGVAPHKQVHTAGEIRLRLAEAAFAGMARVEISGWELERGVPSYTLETTRWARERWGEIIFLVGADQFAALDTWHEPDRVLELARLGVATRPGYAREQLEDLRGRLRDPSRVELFEIDSVDVSSTGVRRRVARGEPVDGLVPRGVARLVEELGLYGRGGADARTAATLTRSERDSKQR